MTTEAKRKYQREFARKRSARIPAAIELLGGECFNCGATENLHFHHPEGVEKRFPISEGLTYSDELFWIEVLKCELLCISCHSSITNVKIGFVHGTRNGYSYWKCRCRFCKEANSQYFADRKLALQG